MEILVGLLVVSVLVYLGYKEWLTFKKSQEQPDIFEVIGDLQKNQEKSIKHFWKEAKKERQELYDRLMSRDLVDYKAAIDTNSETVIDDSEEENDDYYPLTSLQELSEEQKIEIETGEKPPASK
jgi:hypothetical protein